MLCSIQTLVYDLAFFFLYSVPIFVNCYEKSALTLFANSTYSITKPSFLAIKDP